MKKTQLLTLVFTLLFFASCSDEKQKEKPTQHKRSLHASNLAADVVKLLNKRFKKQRKEAVQQINGLNEYQYIIIPTIAKLTNDGKGVNIIETLYSGEKLTKEMAQGFFNVHQSSMEGFYIVEKSIYFPNGFIDYRYKYECDVNKMLFMKEYDFYRKFTSQILGGTAINEVTFSFESCTKYLNHLESKKQGTFSQSP